MRAENPENQYLNILIDIMANGEDKADRTGVGTRSRFGATMRFDLLEGAPILTTKAVSWRTAIREMLWFLTGDTNIRALVQQGVSIWTDWPLARYRRETFDEHITRNEFERLIITDERFAKNWGDLGPVYGAQWRRWPRPDGRHVDQIAEVIRQLRTDPMSRRILLTGWNVADIPRMAIPPRHMTYRFCLTEGRLSLALYQRSCDMFLEVPFNLVGASALLLMIAQQTGFEPGELVWFGADVHIYQNHVEHVREQLRRAPRALPTMRLTNAASGIDGYQIDDFVVEGYDPHPAIKAPVAV